MGAQAPQGTNCGFRSGDHGENARFTRQRPCTVVRGAVTVADGWRCPIEPGHAPAPPAQLELSVHPRGPVGGPGGGVHLVNLVEQLGVVPVPHRGRSAGPRVVTGAGVVEHPAGYRDVDAVTTQLTDQPEHHSESTFYLAKNADARFRISISMSFTRSSRRSRTSSARSSVEGSSFVPSSTSAWRTPSCVDSCRRSPDRLLSQPGEINGAPAELRRVWPRHLGLLSETIVASGSVSG